MNTEPPPPTAEAVLAPAVPPDVPEQVHRGLYRKSGNPMHPDNSDSPNFLGGYLAGQHYDKTSGIDAISDEWERIGSPNVLPASFKEWKRGFNAGSMRRSWEKANTPRHEQL